MLFSREMIIFTGRGYGQRVTRNQIRGIYSIRRQELPQITTGAVTAHITRGGPV